MQTSGPRIDIPHHDPMVREERRWVATRPGTGKEWKRRANRIERRAARRLIDETYEGN